MKKLALIPLIIIMLSCGKDKDPVVPVATTTSVDNFLHVKVDGDVEAPHDYSITIYKKVNGQFEESFRDQWNGDGGFPYYFNLEMTHDFYYVLTMSNFSSVFPSQGVGVINASVSFRGETLFYESDETATSALVVTSPTYSY